MTTLVVLACFFASGFAALTYEIAWIRKATLVFGSTSLALSTVLAVFFLGWALGSRYFGRASLGTDRPLKWFAVIEICVGVFGFLSPWTFVAVESVYGGIYPSVYETAGLLNLTRVVLLTLCLLLPTLLMGGTLPLLCRHFVSTREGITSAVGGLYGLNTVGGAAGCAVCGFLLIPSLGIDTAIFIAAGLNLLLGFSVLAIAPTARLSITAPTPKESATEADSQPTAPCVSSPRLVYALFFATGFIALSNEIIWTRYLSLLVQNSVHTYTLTLTVILAGIGLGGPLAGGLMHRVKDKTFPFGLAQMALGLTAIGLFLYPVNWWLRLAVDHAAGDATRLVILVVSLMLVPAILMGMSFPLAIRLVVDRPSQTGAGVGGMTFVNTIGGVLGSLATGFLLLPLLGLQATILLVTGASVVVGLTILLGIRWNPAQAKPTARFATAILGATLWVILAGASRLRLPLDLLGSRGTVLAFEEGVNANLAVIRSEGVTRLEIDGLWQGEDRRTHLMMSAHVPMLLHPKPKDVLVIGLGTGLASRRFLHYDIDRLDCVEIESELPDLLREHFDSAWMEDDKVRILVEDGRSHLSHTDQEYDVISIAVGQTYRPGVASFYTEEFYERAKQALRSGGCVSQFIPTQMLTTAELQSLIATFLRTFPQSMLWYNTEEMLLVGRDVPKLSFDTDRLRLLLPGTPVHKDLEFRYWGGIANYINRSETLLAGFLVGPKGLAALVGDAPTYTDDRPWIEYSTAESRDLVDEQGTTIKLITRHLGDVSDVLGDKPADASLRFTEALRARHLSDLRAVILTRVARSGRAKNLDEAEAMLRKAIELSPENVKIRHSYAYLLFDLKRVDEALELLTETLNIDPTNAVSYNVMGNALILAGKPEDAIHEFERAIRIDGKNDVPHLNLGQILAKQGQFAKATPHLRICVEQDPENPIAREWLGRALDAQGKTIEAVEQLSHAMRLRPGAPAIAQILVWILATHEDPALPTAEETVAMAEHMAEATRDQSPAILDILAASYARAGRFPEAVQSATQAIDLAKQQKNAELATEIEARRKLYEGKKPYLK